MTFMASAWQTSHKSRMTAQDWWDAGIGIVLVLAAAAIGYLLTVAF